MPSMAPLIGALPKLRQMAESLMTDQCVVTRPGDTTTDSDTGLPNTGKEKVYEGSCKVQTSGGLASEQTEGSAAQAMGAVSLVWSLYVHFPYGTPGDVYKRQIVFDKVIIDCTRIPPLRHAPRIPRASEALPRHARRIDAFHHL